MRIKSLAMEDDRSASKNHSKPSALKQKMETDTTSDLPSDNNPVLHLQRTVGNRATSRRLGALQRVSQTSETNTVQRLSVFAARQLVNKWVAVEGKVSYADLFGLWLMRPGNQQKLEGLDDMALQKELEPMTDMTKTDVDKERIELSYQRDKADFIPTFGKSPVFQHLVEGIELSDAPQINLVKLLNNFKTVSFNYTMQAKSPDNFLKGVTSEGDCNTLVRAFEKIAQLYLGIRDVKYQTSSERGFTSRFSAPKKQTVGTPKTGNVNNGAFWVFENHYWIEYSGQVYDVLFGTLGLDTGVWGKQVGSSIQPETFEVKDGSIASTPQIQIWSTGSSGDITERWTTKAPETK